MTEFRYLDATLRSAGAATKVKWHGRDHYIVPVVALTEGVIHAVNAANPEFVPFEVFSANVSQWNGRPLMLNHPVINGTHVAANAPTVLESGCFGAVFNSRIDRDKRRLLMDAYVDPERLKALGREDLLARVIEGKPIEISIGAGVATKVADGDFRGKAYRAQWMALSADHLAFIPDGRGACSIEAGCGAHRAMASHDDDEPTTINVSGIAKAVTDAVIKLLGGKGSGNFGHAGRPGKVGGSSDDDSGGASYKEGDRVVVSDRHWDKSLHGKTGTVYSSTTSTEGKPTHHVKIDGGRGQFVHADELDAPAKTFGAPKMPPDDDPNHGEDDNGNPSLEDMINSAPAARIPGREPDEKPAKAMTSDAAERAKWMAAEPNTVIAKSPKGTVTRHGTTDFRPFAARTKSGELLGTYSTILNAKQAVHDQVKIKQPENFPSGWRNPAPQPKWKDFEPRSAEEHTRDLAAYKDCPTCQGSGSAKGNPCEVCDGSGELKVAETKETDMNRQAMIEKLLACSCSGYTKDDLKMLEAASDLRLAAFVKKTEEEMAEEEAKKKKEEELKAAEAANRSLEAKVAHLEVAFKAASTRQLTEDEFLAQAPPSIRSLVAQQRAQDEAETATLVNSLKVAAAGAFTEDELKAKSLTELRSLAMLAKVAAPAADYSGRGIPALRVASGSNTNYAPPDPYERDLKALQGK